MITLRKQRYFIFIKSIVYFDANTQKFNFKKSEPLNLSIQIEPTFIAMSTTHLAVGFNNRAWFYGFKNDSK
jgi:hypothetical protein